MNAVHLRSSLPDPVQPLLDLGAPVPDPPWLDYPAMGITREHVPALARILFDDEIYDADSHNPAGWAPWHALRALGQLGATEAIDDLVRSSIEFEFEDNDWLADDVATVFGQTGPAALPALSPFLEERRDDMYTRAVGVESIERIARRGDEERSACVAIL